MIELSNVYFSYNGRVIFNDFSLSIHKGEFAAIIGPTGSGKTTMIQLLLGELLPTKGTITVDTTRVDLLKKKQLATYRRSVGFVFEEIALLEEKTVRENVRLPLEINKMQSAAMDARVEEELIGVHLLDKAKSFPRELSLGEMQRTAIARALVSEPLVLVADVPTSQLDQSSSKEIVSILEDQNVRGMTVLLTMPDLSQRELLPKNTVIYVLRDGSVHPFLPETLE